MVKAQVVNIATVEIASLDISKLIRVAPRNIEIKSGWKGTELLKMRFKRKLGSCESLYRGS